MPHPEAWLSLALPHTPRLSRNCRGSASQPVAVEVVLDEVIGLDIGGRYPRVISHGITYPTDLVLAAVLPVTVVNDGLDLVFLIIRGRSGSQFLLLGVLLLAEQLDALHVELEVMSLWVAQHNDLQGSLLDDVKQTCPLLH